MTTPHAFGQLVILMLLSFRVTADSIRAQLPAEVTMNKGAGRGSWLMVALRLESGEELPFVIDTGSPITLLDKSLEPKLGNCLETMTYSTPGAEQESSLYAAPKLYLGNARLVTDAYVASYSFKRLSARSHQHVMGILGMDCLRHYCIQMDFQAGKMRFLAVNQVNAADCGKAFPLFSTNKDQNFPPMFASAGQNDSIPFIQHVGLLRGASTNLLIDTGDNVDGVVEKGVVKGHYPTRFVHFWLRFRTLRFPECVWDGQTYTRLRVNQGKNANRLGLRFLARHLVTFDFPEGNIYLKQKSIGPLSTQENR